MAKNASFFNGAFATCDDLHESEALAHALESVHIDQIGGGPSVLGDEYGITIHGEVVENFRSPALECGDEFRFHLSATLVALETGGKHTLNPKATPASAHRMRS